MKNLWLPGRIHQPIAGSVNETIQDIFERIKVRVVYSHTVLHPDSKEPLPDKTDYVENGRSAQIEFQGTSRGCRGFEWSFLAEPPVLMSFHCYLRGISRKQLYLFPHIHVYICCASVINLATDLSPNPGEAICVYFTS